MSEKNTLKMAFKKHNIKKKEKEKKERAEMQIQCRNKKSCFLGR